MKKYPKIVQCDKRGQIVIPKDIREDLGIDEGTAFWMYSVTDEGILLKVVKPEPLKEQQQMLDEIEEKADKIGVDKSNLDRSKKKYEMKAQSRLEEL